MDGIQNKLVSLLTQLAGNDGLCVAFSGGVDSALLVKLACDAGLWVEAVTFESTLQPAREIQEAAMQATLYGARHTILPVDPLQDEQVRGNTRERCYRCKYTIFAALRAFAAEKKIPAVVDGTNADDLLEYRPGLRALRELDIESPLASLGITKQEVRRMAAELGLAVAEKPSSPCLATRFPYGETLDDEKLLRVGQAEQFLQEEGFLPVRVRTHGTLARIEVPFEQLSSLLTKVDKIRAVLLKLGYDYVTADLAGFQSGGFDRIVQARKPKAMKDAGENEG